MDKFDGSLRGYMQDRYNNSLTRAEVTDLIGQLLYAYKRIHDSGVSHRDVKPENVLFKHDVARPSGVKLVLCDFGTSKKLDQRVQHSSQHRTFVGTSENADDVLSGSWIAPEVCEVGARSLCVVLFSLTRVECVRLYKSNSLRTATMFTTAAATTGRSVVCSSTLLRRA